MFGNLLFGLTAITYIALAIFNLQKINATGERLVGWGMIGFGLMAAYVVCSLLLTINVAAKGGFNWISNSVSMRNMAVGILWLSMVIGVVFCAMLSTEYHTDPSTGILRLVSLPVYFGATWLPLLMLIPYAILLNTEWRETLSPGLYKIPLIIAGVVGLLIVMAPKMVVAFGINIPQKGKDNAEVQLENIMNSIQQVTSIQELLKYSLDEDERVRNAASAKIKASTDWEDALIKILGKTDEYGHHDFYWVYVFLDDNKVDHPERFIEPVNNTIPAITAEVQRVLNKSFLYTGDLRILNVDGVCRVLDEQFKDSSSVFQPNMLKLQEALDAPPLEQPDTDKDFIELRNTYRLAVKNWLDSH